jgi:AcrR family transcriptional regulator
MTKTKKQVIYEEAAKLFQEKGCNAASMRDLADRVNLKASSLYSHIRRKEEILRKICFDNAQRFTEGMTEVLSRHTDPVQQVQALIRLHIRVALEDPTSVTVFNDEWKHLDPDHLQRFLELRRQYEQQFREIIQAGIEAGAFKSVDPNTALFTVLTSVRWLHYWHRPGRSVDADQLEKDICTLLLSGLEN